MVGSDPWQRPCPSISIMRGNRIQWLWNNISIYTMHRYANIVFLFSSRPRWTSNEKCVFYYQYFDVVVASSHVRAVLVRVLYIFLHFLFSSDRKSVNIITAVARQPVLCVFVTRAHISQEANIFGTLGCCWGTSHWTNYERICIWLGKVSLIYLRRLSMKTWTAHPKISERMLHMQPNKPFVVRVCLGFERKWTNPKA